MARFGESLIGITLTIMAFGWRLSRRVACRFSDDKLQSILLAAMPYAGTPRQSHKTSQTLGWIGWIVG